jgi:hypothetical protein
VKVCWQQPVIDPEDEIKLPVFQKVHDAGLPRDEFELDLVAPVCILLTQARDYDGTDVVSAGNAKGAFLSCGIEQSRDHQMFHLGQQALKLLKLIFGKGTTEA